MTGLDNLLARNRAWAAKIKTTDPEFFFRLAHQQSPQYLWIGCSDSRVPSSQLVDLVPGEMFVHRNVANLVVHTDLNCLSVIQYAVEVLKVQRIIVCGHYGCGGVQAAHARTRMGLIDNWLRHLQDVIEKHSVLLDKIENEERRVHRLCELNVIEQVVNVCQTTVVQEAWARGQELVVDGLIYGLEDGLLRELGICVSSQAELSSRYEMAIRRQSIGLISLVVREYDEALEFFIEKLGFVLVEDSYVPAQDKRWVVVSPPGGGDCRLLLARASTEDQQSRIGSQTGGRVFLFLYTDDFRRDYENYKSRGVVFVREPKEEDYGTVAVFKDLYGNLWDLVQPKQASSAVVKTPDSSRDESL